MKYIFFIILLLNVSVFLQANPELLQKGYEAFNKENFEDAKILFEHSLADPTTIVQAFLGLGQISLKDNNLKCTTKYFSNALEANAKYGANYTKLHTHISKIYDKYSNIEKKNYHEKRAKLLGEPTD